MAILVVMALPWLMTHAASQSDTISGGSVNQDITISLITCYPGPEIYELCGHSAIRVRGEGIDSVWNYGIFDFTEPNFVYRFVKGETDYLGAGYPFAWFLPEYRQRGSRVVEQDLNLTPQEAARLHQILRETVLPQNARYRYNYVKDNCSTRILDKIEEVSGSQVIYPDTVKYGTFRNEMRHYHRGYPWYQFGIDLALGSGLDTDIDSRNEMFVPVEMMENASKATFADGRPFVKATRILNEGRDDASLPPTSPWLTPLFWSWLIFALFIALVIFDIWRNHVTWPIYALWFCILGLGGFLIAFLVFFSSHEATSPNILIFWLNPLQLLFVIGLCFRKLRLLAVTMSWYNIVALTLLFILWPWQRQSANPAFFPLMGISLALAISYAIINGKSSYKNR